MAISIRISRYGNRGCFSLIKILFLIPSLDRGGAENVLVNLVNNMNYKKYEITVQTLFDEDSQKDLLDNHINYKSFLFHQFRGNSIILSFLPSKWLYHLIVKKKYDVVVSYLEGPTAHILSNCPFKETKKVAWIHTAFDSDKAFSVGFRSKARAIDEYNKFDVLAFVAKNALMRFQEISNTPLSKCRVVYNTIDSTKITSLADERIIGFDYPKSGINIISAGKIDPVKGYDRLARVHKRLLDEGIENNIFILGVGSQQKEISAYLNENHLTNTFHFLGFKKNPYKYISRADLFVCSSRREGFSTSVSEALILGVPVVTTLCSGMKEMLGKNDEYGIITDNNEDSLYDGIKKMIITPGMLDTYAKRANERGKMFRIDKTVKDVDDMLMSL